MALALNKTHVSELITGLRPTVKQAAVHLAHHLTKEISRFEKRQAVGKLKKKAERLRKEVILLKKVRHDDVSKYAVMMDFSNRLKLLGDDNLPLETKLMIKIATHKNVVSQIESFRQSHADWKDKLPDLLKNLGIFTQHKKKIEKQQEKSKRKQARKQGLGLDSVTDASPSTLLKNDTKTNKTVSKVNNVTVNTTLSSQKKGLARSGDSSAELESNDKYSYAESNNTEDECDHSDAASDQCGIESDHFDAANEQSSIASDHSDAASDQSDAASDQSDVENEHSDAKSPESIFEAVKITPQNQLRNKTSQKPKGPRISASSAFAEVRRFADLEQEVGNLEKERKLDSGVSSKPNENLSDNETVEEDTFFMTGENKFLKTVAVKRADGEGLQSLDKGAEKKSVLAPDQPKLPGNRAERRARMRGDFSSKKRGPRQKNTSTENGQSHSIGKNMKGTNNIQQYPENKNGKVFRNQKNSNGTPYDKRNGTAFQKFNKKDFGQNKTDNHHAESNSDKSLHPSWEAKRKQKVSIDCFQGKKIKFDD